MYNDRVRTIQEQEAILNVSDLMCEDLLDIVWGNQRGYIDIPAKVGRYWVPWVYYYEGEADNIVTGRIDSALRDEENLYFSAGIFKDRWRRFEDMKPPQWLWADLDEIDPLTVTELGLQPTLAWESSPGRYQAMWRLSRKIRPESFDKLNQALSYYLGADKGGWDRTQVLRIPGTRNWKYPNGPMVTLLWYEPDVVYQPNDIWHQVRESIPQSLWAEDKRVTKEPPRAMPARVRGLINRPADQIVEGERSSVMWKMECLLAEANWSEDDIFRVVSRSAWNKWVDVGTGERRLRTEIRKAMRHVLVGGRVRDGDERKETSAAGAGERERMVDRHSDGGADTGRGESGGAGDEDEDGESDVGESVLVLPRVPYDSFMAMVMEEPRWLIEGIWTAGSQGILGGEPKTSKTTLGLGLAMSVASGECLFGYPEFRVPRGMSGPVLFVQEENAPWMIQDRMVKLANLHGILGSVKEYKSSSGGLNDSRFQITYPRDIPLFLLNNYGLDLTNEFHREAIWRECEELEPRLVVLDPMYMVMAGVNFNQAHELAPYLKWLLALSNEFKCAVIMIHHFRKAQVDNHARPGQRLMGNATLHGFVDSALYCEQIDAQDRAEPGTFYTRVHREFRSIEPQRSLEFGIRMDPPGGLGISVDVKSYDLTLMIERIVQERGKIRVTELSREIGIDKRVIIGRSRDSELIEVERRRQGRGWSYILHPTEMNGRSEPRRQ